MSGKTYLRNPNFFKRDYFEALKFILPGYLYEDDQETTPRDEDLVDVIINSHIDVADNFSSIIPVSATSDSVYKDTGNISGASVFFVKQNNLTNITTQSFEDDILSFFDRRFQDFPNKDSLRSFVESRIIPSIRLNASGNDSDVFSSVGGTSAVQDYLLNKLSWLYLLNTSGLPGFAYDGSSFVADSIVSGLYNGNSIRINDGVKGLSEYIWRNDLKQYYPSAYFASAARNDLSGFQQLDKLKTWIDVIYSPLFSDKSDFRVRDKFDIFKDSGLKSVEKINDGPFARFIRALSFLAFDIDNDTEQISTLYDLDECPDEFLPMVAQLIGWDLFGSNPDRWRLQLRSAVSIYKAVGTKRAVQRTVETVFPKDKFPIEGRITELWESYVPYLIYYALATESPSFRDYSTWTQALARSLGVEGYSTISMDENIRLAVDRILLEVITRFPDNFPINQWIKQNDSVFNYRGRDYPIPPFEEYPYYVNTELSQEMLAFITDRLSCFGVGKDFALDVSGYIDEYALRADDEPRLGSWLIFTSGYNNPPNFDRLVRNLNENSFDYVDLWSGKSSHFKLVLSASEFDFAKSNLDSIDTRDAVSFVSKATNKVAPAHSIPVISLEVSGEPDLLRFESASALPIVYFDREEIEVAAGRNSLASGLYARAYKRGGPDTINTLPRSATETLASPQYLNSVLEGELPRNSSRRRSYEKIMPFNGYYDRTGLNMPVSFNMASGIVGSGVPLGFIPSSLTYTEVSSHINLPEIWDRCQGLNSSSEFFGYTVSDTQNVRGASGTFESNKDRTTDRGQLPGIYAVMHRIKEGEKYLKTILVSGPLALQNQIASSTSPSDIAELETKLSLQTSGDLVSITNRFSNSGVEGYAFPETARDYYDFSFGRDIHRLYHVYQDNFAGHRLSPDVQDQDGANIFSHTFGPLLYNHDFSKIDIGIDTVTRSFGAINLTFNSSALGKEATKEVTYLASGSDSMFIDKPERVVSGIVDGVELILTSGTDGDSSIAIINIPDSLRRSIDDPFLFDNTFIIMRSGVGAMTRLRFDISKYGADSDHPVTHNFLSPEHEFKVDLNAILSEDTGRTLGGRSMGMWIHTKPENGKMWSYTPESEWIQHDQIVKKSELLSEYAHNVLIPLRANDTLVTSSNQFECLEQVTIRTSPVLGLGSEDLDNLSVTFNTRNRDILLPKDYQKSHNQLHRLDQEYVVEVFMFPGSLASEFIVVDKVSIQDMTMKKLSEFFSAGKLNNPLCKLDDLKKLCEEFRLHLTKQDIFDIFKHFNNIAGLNASVGYASRDKDKTETIMESKGGSRIDYRYQQNLFETNRIADHEVVNTITIDT